MLKLYNVDETPLQPLLDKFGYKDMERCLFLGFTDGEKGYSRNVARNIAKIALRHGGMPLTGYVTRSWEKGRFNDPYLRDTLMDFGITTDTLECTVNWSNMEQVHADVRKICHALPNTVVTTHMSHCYPQGANLYFIFLTRMQDEDAFKAYHTTILDAIQRSGAAVSHHHGIGKMFAPWLEGYIGEKEYGVFRVLKDYFDPDYNMNPGGTIGLDLKPEEKKFLREYLAISSSRNSTDLLSSTGGGLDAHRRITGQVPMLLRRSFVQQGGETGRPAAQGMEQSGRYLPGCFFMPPRKKNAAHVERRPLVKGR